MKSKWQLALTCLVIGMAALTGKIAYAETPYVGMYDEPSYCSDWSFNDSTCSASLTRPSGKAAYGETSEKSALPESTMNACEDWSFNTPGCAAYISRAEGKAAFGATGGERKMPAESPLYCADWNLSDANCAGTVSN